MKPKAIIIAGPTAVGKTAITERIAAVANLPIISADSRQIYKELGIAVAKPLEESLRNYKYTEVNSTSIFEEHDVTDYCKRVESFIRSQNNSNLLVCGGTGFYLKALLEGFEVLPKKNSKLREKLDKLFKAEGIERLQRLYKQIKHPQEVNDLSNPQRLIRAIEIGEKNENNTRIKAPLEGYDTVVIGLNLPREELYKRINIRVDEMVDEGIFDEAEKLFLHRNLNALQTVGYSEIFKYLEGDQSKLEAIEEIKKNTRRYAKRQITFFKNQFPDTMWFNPKEYQKINTFVQNILK